MNLYFNTASINEDVRCWDQTPEELAAWTVEDMYKELCSVDWGSEATDCVQDDACTDDCYEITLEELAQLYTDAAHELAAELIEED